MNILLVVRSEIIAIIIELFLIIYDRSCAKYREGKDRFIPFALTALGHVVMGLITEITVNTKNFPVWLNNIFHILFFAFALLFSLRYFEYILSMISSKKHRKKLMIPAYILSFGSIIVMFFSKIDYLEGKGTYYSAGTGPTLCYMLGFVLFILADIILVVNHKRVATHVFITILPLSVLALGLMVVQIIVPEFLFTGCALILISVGVFFSIENPIGKFRDRAFIDLNTQTWNRNCYEFDMNNMKAFTEQNDWIYVIGDITGLKETNDRHGHLSGDRMIETVAAAMLKNMNHAYRIYRIGGDEFVAIYIDQTKETVESEIKAVTDYCETADEKPIFFPIGYAEHQNGELPQETAKRADRNMYLIKEKYYTDNGIEHRR